MADGTCKNIEDLDVNPEEGTYITKVKTRDVHGAESDWATLEVSMPKSKTTEYATLSWFFEKILNQII